MPRNISKADVLVDPVAAWRGTIPQPQPADVIDISPGFLLDSQITISPATSTASTVDVQITQPARRFCTQCGAEGVTAARFCHNCGSSLNPAPVASSFAAEQGARVTQSQIEAFMPKPAAALSPEERAERQRQHIAAVEAGRRDPPLEWQPPSGQLPSIVIHFREDGLTFAGQVWMRGQEIELEEGTQRWHEAQAWINMTDFQQMERYGKIMFAHGPWPGRRSYAEGAGSFQQLEVNGQKYEGPNVTELLNADLKERRRGRAVPAPTTR